MFTILCSVYSAFVGIGNTLVAFKPNQQVLLSNECSSIFYSWPNWREKGSYFGVEKPIELSSKLSLTSGDNVNYYKNVHRPVPTRRNRKHLGNFQNKSVISPFNWVSRYILLGQTEGKRKSFFGGCKKRGSRCEITPKSTWLSQKMKTSLLLWNLK